MVYFVHEFRPYLLGKRFILRTDHSALTWLMSFKEPTGQVARWIQKLQEYQFSIQYRSNLAHRNADALSRRPHRRHGECPSCTTETTVSTIQWPFTSTSDDLLISQQTYHPTATVINWLYTKQTNPQSAQDRNLQKYVQHYSAFQLIDGLLHIKKTDDTNWRLVLPPTWRNTAIHQYHDNPTGGHNGKYATYIKIKSRYWWPGMKTAIYEWVDTCGVCGQCRGPNPKTVASLQPIESTEPLHCISIDIVRPFQTF